jgi:MFS family permease
MVVHQRVPLRRRFDSYAGALSEHDFRLLYIGRVVSITGDKIAPIALAFAILDLTGSPADLGYILAARVVAMVSLLLVGGVWADRLPRRTVLVGTDLLRFASQGTTAVLLLGGWAAVWQLILLQAAAGAGQAFFRPASTGLIPHLVSAGRLQQANALLAISEQGTTIAGPVIAGAIVVAIGSAWAIGLDALTYATSALFLLRLRLVETRSEGATSFLADLAEGFAEFRSRAWLVAFVGEYALYHLVFFAPLYVLGPTVASRELGGAPAWAAILASYGVGAIAGGIAGLRLRPRRPLRVVALLFALDAPVLLALASGESVPLIAAAALLSGAASGFAAPVWETTLQQRVPAESLSRVSSFDWLGSMAFLPLGYAIVGPAAAWLGTEAVLVAGAALLLASVPLLFAVRAVRAG